MGIRTDLAMEAKALWEKSAGKTTKLAGVRARERERDGFAVTDVHILDRRGEAALGKPAGRYVTLLMVDDNGVTHDLRRFLINSGGRISFDVPVARDGQPLADYDEGPVAAHLKGEDVTIEIDLGLGDGRAIVWTCDLTHGYIAINADYRS